MLNLILLLAAGLSLATIASPRMVAQQPANFIHTEVVEVVWEGIPATADPTSDWVSLWWTPFKATYVEYVNVTGATPTGSASFELLNARHPFHFRYYRNSQLLAQSNEIFPVGAYPHQLRLSLVGEQEDAMRVSWTSNRSMGDGTVVQYGLDPSLKDAKEVIAGYSTYTHQELNARVYPDGPEVPIMSQPFPNIGSRQLRCGSECYQDNTTCLLFVDPGLFHGAVLTGLKPLTKYFYRVGERDGLMSEIFSFTSRPSSPISALPISILYFADGGIGGNGEAITGLSGGATNNDPPANGGDTVWAAVAKDQATARDDLLLFNGDISYARGWPYTWEVFHNQTSFLRHTPGIYSYGNHEFDFHGNPWEKGRGHDSGGEAGIVAARRFDMGNTTDPVSLARFGPVVVATLSSEHEPSSQASTLNQTLRQLDRTRYPWVIVQLHRPLYSSAGMDPTSMAIGKALLPVLEDPANRVDLVLTGHKHYYERMCAIRNGQCVKQGDAPTYILDGSAGAEFSPASTPDSPLTHYKEFEKWGYSRILVNSTSLTWNHMHTSRPGIAADSVTLYKTS